MTYYLEKRSADGTPSGSNQDLTTVIREIWSKNSGLEAVTDVEADSSSTEFVDIESPTKKIDIEGVVTGDIAALRAYITEMDRWIAGTQDQGTVTYTSDLISGTIEVKILDGNWEWENGSPGRLTYQLKLVESA